jgi:hypothetical protein
MVGLRQTVRDLWQSLSAGSLYGRRADMPGHVSSKGPHERGIQFLAQNLSPAQRQQYERHGYFDVCGGATGKRYRIHHGHQMNVEELDQDGRRNRLLCFVPRGGLPVGDIMLAQKIALELFESDAISVANRSLAWDHIEEEMRLRRRFRR